MAERHKLIGPARGEPRLAGRVGICLRFRLSGNPSPRWARDLGARLVLELTGHPGIGHLRLNNLCQGSYIVLDGVESDQAPSIAGALQRAVQAANRDCANDPQLRRRKNLTQREADAIARRCRSEADRGARTDAASRGASSAGSRS
jgi:hypothetical protein